MKNILYFTLTALFFCSLISCNKDDDTENIESYITVTINGKPYTFNTIKVMVYEEETFIYRDFYATIDNNPNRIISFSLNDYPETIDGRFFYTLNDNHYTYGSSGSFLNSTLSTHNATKIIGNFSGKLSSLNNESVTLEDGVINIIY